MQTLHWDEAPKLECSYMCVEQIAINHLYLIANLKSFHSNIFVKMTNHDLMQDLYFFIINFNEIRISFFLLMVSLALSHFLLLFPLFKLD